MRTLSKYPNLIEEMPSFEVVLKDCFMKQDQRLPDEDFGYTQDFIGLVDKAFDPYDKSIKAIY